MYEFTFRYGPSFATWLVWIHSAHHSLASDSLSMFKFLVSQVGVSDGEIADHLQKARCQRNSSPFQIFIEKFW